MKTNKKKNERENRGTNSKMEMYKMNNLVPHTHSENKGKNFIVR